MVTRKGQDSDLPPRLLRAISTTDQKIATKGLPARQVEAARSALQSLNAQCIVLSDKYNQASIKADGKDARQLFDEEEVNKDRATLNSLFADEYSFVDPFGLVGNKESTVETILSGKVRKDAFKTAAETLQIHGNAIVSSGKFSMKGSMKVKFKKSGVTRKRDISGDYNSTHTYVERDGRLLLAASHLTKEPSTLSRGRPGEPDIETE
jgi:hypothetical protein